MIYGSITIFSFLPIILSQLTSQLPYSNGFRQCLSIHVSLVMIFISVTYKATRLNSISTNLFIPPLFGETQRPCLKLVSAVLPYLMFGALVLKVAQKRDRVVCSRLTMDLTIFILMKYTRFICSLPIIPIVAY